MKVELLHVVVAASFVSGCGCQGLWAEIPPYVPADPEVGSDVGDVGSVDTGPDVGVDAGVEDMGPDVTPDMGTADASHGDVGMEDVGDDAEVLLELDPPQNARAQGESGGVRVLWSAVDGAQGYEVSVDGGAWQDAGSGTEFLDADAPEGTLAGALTVTATDATSPEHVELTASGSATGVPGATRSYRVRAVAGDVLSDPSFEVQSARTVGAISYRWQRTSEETTNDFTDIAGSSGLTYLDTAAPATGEKRRFRVVASAEGTTSELSSADDLGWRLAAVKVSVGFEHACAILSNGKLKCWGRNNAGQLGYGSRENIGDEAGEMPPPDVDVGEDVVDVALSDFSTCVVTVSGKIKCWGDNAKGQLGRGDTEDIGDEFGEMPPADMAFVGTAVDIDAGGARQGRIGEDYYCALNSAGDVYCWGSAFETGLGLEVAQTAHQGDDSSEIPPAKVDVGFSNVRAIDVGGRGMCATNSNDRLYCWGAGSAVPGVGVIGDESGEMPPPLVPTSYTGSADTTELGSGFVCTLEPTGGVRCWGSNGAGELGYGDDTPRPPDGSAPGLVDYTARAPGQVAVGLTTGFDSTCVLTSVGSVVCWGMVSIADVNGAQNIGDQPNEIPAPLPFGVEVVGLAETGGNNRFTCALLATGEVTCWGTASSATFGQGNPSFIRAGDVGTARVVLW